MEASRHFHQLLKRDFAPLLRAEGFKGTGATFRRVKDDVIHVVNIQGSHYGDECCVNLGLHFSFLPTAGDSPLTNPAKLKDYECEFRDRVHEADESDHWWAYGSTEAEAQANAANLIDMYRRRGRLFFQGFEPFPDVFERVTPAQIDAGDLSHLPAEMTLVRAALTMARIMHHLGRSGRCRHFAQVGLRHLGRAVGLKEELQRLRAISAPLKPS
jgi:hypothetical protein